MSEWRAIGKRGDDEQAGWLERLEKHPRRAAFERRQSGALPTDGTARLMIGWLKLQKRARQWRHVKPAVWS